MSNPSGSVRKARFGPYEVDFRAGELLKNGRKIRLQDQPLQILAMLLEQPGGAVTREELRERLWPTDTFVDFDHGLNNAINKLRDALNDSAETPRFIETLPRRGYRFIAEVQNGAPLTEPSPVSTPSGELPPPITSSQPTPEMAVGPPHRRLKKLWFAAAALGLVAALLLGLNLRQRQRLFASSAPTRIQSIAVIPLENLSGDPSQEYFADGMTDALTTELARVSALRVVSKTSASRYKGTKKSLPEIARELGVDAIVEGAVIRSRDRVRIDAQLIQGTTDRHLWARGYERKVGDVVALQGEVAQAITDEIHIRVTPEERARLSAASPVNPEAYEAYLKGRFLWNERTEKAVTKGLDFFEQAIAKDPRYAPAYSGLSDSYGLLGFFGALPPKEAYPRAKVAATKALELDPSLGEAHVSLADTMCWWDWDWPGADAEFKRAIELNPRYDNAYRKYSNYLAGMGRKEESIAAAKKAIELDPLSVTFSTHLAWMYYLARQYDLAAQQFEKTLDMSPNYARARRDFSLTLIEKGDYEGAIREARRGIELSEPSPAMLKPLGYAYAKAGRKGQARQVLRDLQQMSKSRYVPSFDVAVIYAGLGEKDAAFSFLEKAYQEHAGQLIWLNVYPILDSLRSERRFADLVRRIGLSQSASRE
ncbi:MAG TPA: winged helix-turn-helix domain-containing protein [Candidatus Acidoferrum sp.]|nr:winged helix-turn-helix domain-containing protein [Candidatus Acidoferrum sp.]